MRKVTLKFAVLFFSVVLASGCIGTAQTGGKDLTDEQATKWFISGDYLNGLKIKPHESTNKLEFAKQYQKNKALWDKAFAYLKETNLETIAPGKYPIDGDNVFASVTENKTKDFKDTKYESHVKYIDLQCVIKGEEKMGKVAVSKAINTSPYDPAKDLALYTSEDGTFYEATPGVFFLFFSQDAHRPNIKVEGFDSDKKIVIKIKAD